VARADGVLSLEEITGCPGWPGSEYIERKKVAVLECVEDIPCNPCEAACPAHAIAIGSPITNLPAINGDSCTGCNICVAICPGLACFVVEKNYSAELAAVALPYELLPLPEVGEAVRALDRSGNFLCQAEVVRVQKAKRFDKTAVVTVTVDKRFVNDARSIESIEVADHDQRR
jgi:Fe-S-cluster-containing hydrogenase component 2